MKKMMLSCKEVVKTISSEEKIHWRKRLEIRFHLFICHHCGKYAKQLDLLKASLRKVFVNKNQDQKSDEIIQLEDKIIQQIKTKR